MRAEGDTRQRIMTHHIVLLGFTMDPPPPGRASAFVPFVSRSWIFSLDGSKSTSLSRTHALTTRQPLTHTRCNPPPLVSAPARSRRPARRSSRGTSPSFRLCAQMERARVVRRLFGDAKITIVAVALIQPSIHPSQQQQQPRD